ncbi:MAG: chemotaxis protein CheB [Mariprofundaceae bacterium]|nr:chemotaxis protein CheB [Mariprofundaceae bacterium]
MFAPPYRHIDAIVIGASAGGIDFLLKFLSQLPQSCPCPIFIVVHQKADGKHYLCDVLSDICPLPLLEAEDKMSILAGHVYIAPADYHLMIESSTMMSLSQDELVHSCRPSINILFESAADVFQCRLIGMVLTGMGCDGSEGLAYIERLGGVCLVEDPSEAAFPFMPEAAIQCVPTAKNMKTNDFIQHLFLT